MNPLPSAIPLPQAEVVKHDPIRGKIVWQIAPRTAVARDVQDRVDDLATLVLRRPSARFRLRNPRRDPSPLGIRQVGRVGVPSHAT